MIEIEKLGVGLEYCFFYEGVVARKENALRLCQKFNTINSNNCVIAGNSAKKLINFKMKPLKADYRWW